MSDTPTSDSLALFSGRYRNTPRVNAKRTPPPLVVRFKGVAFSLADFAQDVDERVSERLGISVADMRRTKQKWSVARARHASWAIIRWGTGASMLQIAHCYGYDHTTVLHGLTSIAARSRSEFVRTLMIGAIAKDLERDGWDIRSVRRGMFNEYRRIAKRDRAR